MKESSKSAWDTDVTIQLAVSRQSKKKQPSTIKTTLSQWDPLANEDGIHSIATCFAFVLSRL